jgi:hypothetical protein
VEPALAPADVVPQEARRDGRRKPLRTWRREVGANSPAASLASAEADSSTSRASHRGSRGTRGNGTGYPVLGTRCARGWVSPERRSSVPRGSAGDTWHPCDSRKSLGTHHIEHPDAVSTGSRSSSGRRHVRGHLRRRPHR